MSRPITRLRIGSSSIPSPLAINLTAGGGGWRKRRCLQATARQRPVLMGAPDGSHPGYESVQRRTLAWGSRRQNSARPLPAASQPASICRARAGPACTSGSSGQFPKRSCSMQRRSSAHVDHGPSAERKGVAMRGDVRRRTDHCGCAISSTPAIDSQQRRHPASQACRPPQRDRNGKTIVANPTAPQPMP